MKNLIRNHLLARRRNQYAREVHDYFASLYPDLDTETPVEGEEAHIRKWSGLGHDVDPVYYRVFYHISGNTDPNFVPENIHSQVVLKILNEQSYNLAYADKNFYDQFYSAALLPETLFRNINGDLLSAEYTQLPMDDQALTQQVESREKFIIKPSIHSVGGQDIHVFRKIHSRFEDSDGNLFSTAFLKRTYGKNFIAQQYIRQHPVFASLNESSLNTLRIFTYRSVADEEFHILGTYLRVGGENSDVDNVSAGGGATPLDEQGNLREFLTTVRGEKIYTLRDQPVSSYGPIPAIDRLRDTAKAIARKNIHHRLLGLDLTLDENDTVKFIEVNNGYIGCKDAQVSGLPLYGRFTDEIIDYCKRFIHRAGSDYIMNVGGLYLANKHQIKSSF